MIRRRRLLALGLTGLAAATATAAPAPGAEVRPAALDAPVGLTPVDGGPDYWSRFPGGLPSSPSFFPLAVWFESVLSTADTSTDRSAGLNTYVELTSNTDLSLIGAAGMHALHGNGGAVGPETNGWVVADEADMWGGPGSAGWTGNYPGEGAICSPAGGRCGYTIMQTLVDRLPPGGRMRYTGYGKGVLFWESDAEAARFVNGYQDVSGADAYWFTDNNVCGASEGGSEPGVNKAEGCHVAANYGWNVRRQRSLVSPAGSRPIWGIVEVGHPFSENNWPSITPPQTRAAVWQSLIAGARGIIYFNHSFGGPCSTQHALREPCYAEMRATVTATNRQVAALAPVLNAPFATSGWSQGPGTTAMVKWAGGQFYVFAGSAGGAAAGTFTIPCVGDATATALFEDRSVPVSGGTFRDSFADGDAVHVYRIDGGGTCGLPADASTAPVGPAGAGATSAVRATARVGRLPRRVSLRGGRLSVPVTCSTTCTVRGRLSRVVRPRGSRRTRRVTVAAATRRLAAGRHVLVLRLSARARRGVARARRPLRMRVATVASYPGGSAARTQRMVLARRGWTATVSR